MIAGVFVAGGALAGALQARLLAVSARRGPHPLAAFARLSVVGGVLLAAARAEHLGVAAGAWAAGLLVAGAVTWWRLR